MNVHQKLLELALQAAELYKLGGDFVLRLPTLGLDKIYTAWKDWTAGRPVEGISLERMPNGEHGRAEVRGGRVTGIFINIDDTPRRQEVAVVHELLHKAAHPVQPLHIDLHHMAIALARDIFPFLRKKEDTMVERFMMDRSEQALLNALAGASYNLNDNYNVADEYAVLSDQDMRDADIFLSDNNLYDPGWNPFKQLLGTKRGAQVEQQVKKNVLPVLLPGIGSVIQHQLNVGEEQKKRAQAAAIANAKPAMVIEKKADAGIGGDVVKDIWGGWIISLLKNMFESQSFVLPRSGIVRATPVHNISRFKAPSFEAWWNQLTQSLLAGAQIAIQSTDIVVAAAGVATVANLGARSIGAICRLSDSTLQTDNRRVAVRHFTQVGATELEYIMDVKYQEGKAEWIAIHGENDRGGLVPTSLNDHQITINADGIRPGAILDVSSINLREMEA